MAITAIETFGVQQVQEWSNRGTWAIIFLRNVSFKELPLGIVRLSQASGRFFGTEGGD